MIKNKDGTKMNNTNLDPDGCKTLMAAVVEQAVKDYARALNILKKHLENSQAQAEVSQCELFFGKYADAWTNIDGKKIIEAVREKISKKKIVNKEDDDQHGL